MRLNRLTVFCLCVTLLALAAAPTSAQEFRGRINGTVTDNTGAVLPGVTVTATSPALIQPQVQVTGSGGGMAPAYSAVFDGQVYVWAPASPRITKRDCEPRRAALGPAPHEPFFRVFDQ